LVVEVEVLHPKLERFRYSHAGPIEDLGKQTVGVAKMAQDSRDFILGENDREATLFSGPAEFSHPRQIDAEDPAIQEEQRGEGLSVG
jgi:hypothetical protein